MSTEKKKTIHPSLVYDQTQQSTLKDWVQNYNTNGFGTVPSRDGIPRDQKGRYLKEYQIIEPEILVDLSQYDTETQFDAILPDWCIVIDVDPRHFSPERDDWKRFKDDFGLHDVVENTFVVDSKSGGVHVYLRKPENMTLCKSRREYSGIEILNLKITGASSYGITPEGQAFSYSPRHGKLENLSEAPFSLLSAYKRNAGQDRPADPTGEIDREADIKQYIECLKQTRPTVVGEIPEPMMFSVCCRGRDYALSQKKALELIMRHLAPRCFPPWDPQEVEAKLANAYTYNRREPGCDSVGAMFNADIPSVPGLDGKPLIDLKPQEKKVASMDAEDYKDPLPYPVTFKTKTGDPNGVLKPSFENLVNFLRVLPELRGAFVRNDFSGHIELRRELPWTNLRPTRVPRLINNDILNMRMLFNSSAVNIDFKKSDILDAIEMVSAARSYHPIQDYLNSLVWDGTPRLDRWLTDYFKADDIPYTRHVARKTLTAAVARVFKPGCKFDYMLVLEGPEGMGKSSFIEQLTGPEWFASLEIDPKKKDSVDAMRGRWIIELAEMVTSRNSDSESLKAFLTRGTDLMRLPYAPVTEEFPRQSIFIGTANPDRVGYLDPNSANRRYWIVPVYQFPDFDKLKQERHQLWAEAKMRYDRGEPLYLKHDIELQARALAKNRTPQDPFYEPIAEWVIHNYELGTNVPVSVVMELALNKQSGYVKRYEQVRVENILRNLGFKKRSTTIKGVKRETYAKDIPVRAAELGES